MAMDEPDEALIAYEISNELSPNRFNGVYGAASAAITLGDQEKAVLYFEQLLKLAEGINSNRFELEEARKYLKET
jgi:tetratricopeptide (TPR) repeat protein